MNCYVVQEEDELTLVDSTISSPGEDIAALVKRLGKQLRRVALTHAHGDHVGGVAGVRTMFPGVEVSISERDGRILAGEKAPTPHRAADAGQRLLCEGRLEARPIAQTWRPRRLAGGRRLARTYPGHVAFFHVRDNALIAGDAFQTRGGVAVSGDLRLLFPFVAMATWNRPAALTSAKALRALNPSLLAVGHGEAISNPGVAMDQAIEAARTAFGQSQIPRHLQAPIA